MNFIWNKKGMIFNPIDRYEWMQQYAQVPTILELNDRLRIYFTCRPKPDTYGKFVSYISFIDVDKSDPEKVLYIHDKPVLDLGVLGSFDEFGTHPCCFIFNKEELFFYYQGWSRPSSVPYETAIGLATSDDLGLSFNKFSKGPLFGRNYQDPFLENGFFVYSENQSYYLFYASCKEWINLSGKLEPVYKIVMATSSDGINWHRKGVELFNPKFDLEASGRPCVIKIKNLYHMWFCYRNVKSFRGDSDGAYRIGYAYSTDLINWTRDDDRSGIDISSFGWDSEMIAYPYVCKVKDKYFMFYNGNNFGRDGFGYAELIIK
jgi:hypothetical protein